MNHEKQVVRTKLRRKRSTRKRLIGTAEKPRLTVFRSHKHIYCQVVDDFNGVTIASASTLDTAIRDSVKYGGNCDAASLIGKAVAEKALSTGVKRVCFDRGCYKYHGRVAALAEAAREAGLAF